MVERNWYLIKRYGWWEIAFFFWSAANTLTIVFIAKGIEAAGGQIDINRATTIAADRRGDLVVPRPRLRVHDRDGRVGALGGDDRVHVHGADPRAVHLLGVGIFAVALRHLRSAVLFVVIALLFGLHMPNANFLAAAFVLIAVASVSFVGIGTMTAVLPLISPEKGTQFGFVAQGLMLVVSGVYYPVSVLPDWMQWLSKISPATYALRGER